MSQIINLAKIKEILDRVSTPNLIQLLEEGFVSYSQKKVIVPPVGHLRFTDPPGDVHIKYGYCKSDDYYVIKIASGFYQNNSLGLPVSNGLMLVFSQKSGELLAVLLDEGYLTDIRTALAGAIAAKYLGPKNITALGIVGTGIQASLQLSYLKEITSCRKVFVFGRSKDKLATYKRYHEIEGFMITTTTDLSTVTKNCNLIVTATNATEALLSANNIQPGTHITAMGADGPGKQELDPLIITNADIVVADSIEQCVHHGEISYAVKNGLLDTSKIIELGNLILDKSLHRKNDSQVTVSDLTGVAVQDIQIAKFVYLNYLRTKNE